MATGFMPRIIAVLLAAGACLAGGTAQAADIALVGTIGDKAAILAVDGSDPKAVRIGQSWRGITVLGIEGDRATIETEGKKRVLVRGQTYRPAETAASAGAKQSVMLAADSRGHFITEGAINGMPVRFLVDTGASSIALPAAEAQRLGIDYRKGERGYSQTANGAVPVYVVRLDRVSLGAIEINGVEASVFEKGLSVTLLGMSFLNRVDMRRDGETMTLIRRF
jgi:aspartyl protease family protein